MKNIMAEIKNTKTKLENKVYIFLKERGKRKNRGWKQEKKKVHRIRPGDQATGQYLFQEKSKEKNGKKIVRFIIKVSMG